MNLQNFLAQSSAYTCGIISMVCFVIMQLFVKMLEKVMLTTQIFQIRFFLLLAINSYFMFINRNYSKYENQIQLTQKVSQNQQKNPIESFSLHLKDSKAYIVILKRSILSSLAIFLYIISLQYNTLSVCNSLYNFGPIMLFFIQSNLQKKPFKKTHFTFTVVAFCGVILMIKPQSLNNQIGDADCQSQISEISCPQQTSLVYMDLFYKFLPILAAFANCLAFRYLHKMKDSCHKLIALQYNFFISLFFMSLLLNFINVEVSPSPSDQSMQLECSIFNIYFLSLIVSMVVFAYIANYFRVLTLYKAVPTKVVPLNYIWVLGCLLIDTVWFNSQIQMLQIFGIFLTSGGLFIKLLLDIKDDSKK